MKKHTYIKIRTKSFIIMMILIAVVSAAISGFTTARVLKVNAVVSEPIPPTTVGDPFPVEITTENGLILPGDFTQADYYAICKTLYGEARYGAVPEVERSMVVWAILNRLDAGRYGDSLYGICVAENQFDGYDPENPVTKEDMDMVLDVVSRWWEEKKVGGDVGRTLPREYCWFESNSLPEEEDWHNAFYTYSEGNYGEKIYYTCMDNNPYK